MTLAITNWTAIGTAGTLVIGFLGAATGIWAGVRAERNNRQSLAAKRSAETSASTARTIEVGVTNLVDQLQEERVELKHDVEDCRNRCIALETKVRYLEGRVDEHLTTISDQEATIIRLKRRLGEL